MLPLETTPTALTPKIRDFCHGIVPDEQPVFVQVQPAEGAERGYSLENVARYAAQFGGSSCAWLVHLGATQGQPARRVSRSVEIVQWRATGCNAQ